MEDWISGRLSDDTMSRYIRQKTITQNGMSDKWAGNNLVRMSDTFKDDDDILEAIWKR